MPKKSPNVKWPPIRAAVEVPTAKVAHGTPPIQGKNAESLSRRALDCKTVLTALPPVLRWWKKINGKASEMFALTEGGGAYTKARSSGDMSVFLARSNSI
jgi:hypothetical protein